MTDEQRADAAMRATEAMLNAIRPVSEDRQAAIMAVGSLLGCMATVHGEPEAFAQGVMLIASGIVSGELLNDA